MRYADTAFEEVSPTTWVRKTFLNDGPRIDRVRVCIAGTSLRGRGRLAGTFNGKPFERSARSNNRWYGVALSDSDKNTLAKNTATWNDDYGIHLLESSNNTLTNNAASSNDYGVYLIGSSSFSLTPIT